MNEMLDTSLHKICFDIDTYIKYIWVHLIFHIIHKILKYVKVHENSLKIENDPTKNHFGWIKDKTIKI